MAYIYTALAEKKGKKNKRIKELDNYRDVKLIPQCF